MYNHLMSAFETNQAITLPDGRRLAYAEYGNPAGRPVFHFHGSAGSHLDRPSDQGILWELGIRFISVDRPGHGGSDYQPNRRLLDWPGDLSYLADLLGLDTFYVEGWSAGGPHALACAWSLPERVKAVALIASAAPMARPGAFPELPLPNRILAASARWAPPLTHFLRWLTRLIFLRDPAGAVRGLMASIPQRDKAALSVPENFAAFEQSVRQGYHSGSRGVAHDDVIINRDWGFDLASIQVPVDVWHGEADANVPIAGGRYLATALPRARPFFLPGEGHFFVLYRWGEVLATLNGT
jgi:pimeloyl-ACP methyl ester carboxylesterase